MQGGVIGGICLLAFLLSKGRAEETNGLNDNKLETPSDLKNELAVTESNSQDDDDERSGTILQSASHNVEGSSLTQAEAGVNSDSGLYNPGANSYPYSPSYSFSSGVNLPRPQAEPGNGLYQRELKSSPNFNYQPGKSSASPTNVEVSFNQHLRDPNYMSFSKYRPSTDLLSDLSSTYQHNPETNSVRLKNLFQSIKKPYQPPSIPKIPYHFLVPYNKLSSSQTQKDNEAYEPVPLVKPKENYYKVSHRSHAFNSDSGQVENENNPYRAISIQDSNPVSVDSMLVPYREPTHTQTKSINYAYQTFGIPTSGKQREDFISRPYSGEPYSADILTSTYSKGFDRNTLISKSSGESDPYQAVVVPDSIHMAYNDGSSFSQRQTADEVYRPILRIDPSEVAVEPSQSISRSELDPASNGPPSNSNTKVHVHNDVSDITSGSHSFYAYNTLKNPGYDPATGYDLMTDLKSKSDWTSYEYAPPSVPTPQLYPLGADKQGPAAGGVINQYSLGPYDYPSESPFRPGYNKATYEGSSGKFPTQQSSPIAFEDAKSRTILPHEYIFPNKMPGGENVIQCTKENEFHHFWSEGVDCMTCICVNEYGVLTPICANCGGCRKPSPHHVEYIPDLPVPIPVQPATPESVPMIPEPYSPEPERPNPEPNLEIPTPEPYPKYPAPIPGPSPLPDSFPEPIPTLPPQPAEATCSPLPNGQPFTNPLHPCQICTCKESDVSGNVDVQIECKENPQCISPVDLTTLPPLPEVPVPIPLPICEKFPEHVLFPHPTDNCKMCKCSKRDSENGTPEQVLTCYPHPDCIPKPEVVTESVPSLPIPFDPHRAKPVPEPDLIPSEPLKGQLESIELVPLPEIVTVEPLPWPPITTVSPGPPLPMLAPPPGPLPGPSPHESCRPYPPNQTFQHPWDECQICLCTEATAVGMITVEVNCYTKPSCCVEPPEPVKAALPGELTIISGYARQYSVGAPDAQSLLAATSTFRPPSIYPSYTPRTVNYPGTNQGSAADGLKQGYSIQTYPMLQTETGYVDPPSNYPYQRNYQPPFVNQEYPEYPPRIKVPPGSYKPNQFAYSPNYQYAPGDAMENNYAGPQGHYQPYDPRFQAVPSAYAAPSLYQRPGYDRPSVYPPAPSRDVYGKPNQIGANVQNVQSNYLSNAARTKSGKDDDEAEDS